MPALSSSVALLAEHVAKRGNVCARRMNPFRWLVELLGSPRSTSPRDAWADGRTLGEQELAGLVDE
jgi:hypothetical protein